MKGDGSGVTETGEGNEQEPGVGTPDGALPEDGEFQLTIRKLELPVRPRGVLAE